jgi:hypothetical protein
MHKIFLLPSHFLPRQQLPGVRNCPSPSRESYFRAARILQQSSKVSAKKANRGNLLRLVISLFRSAVLILLFFIVPAPPENQGYDERRAGDHDHQIQHTSQRVTGIHRIIVCHGFNV